MLRAEFHSQVPACQIVPLKVYNPIPPLQTNIPLGTQNLAHSLPLFRWNQGLFFTQFA